MAGTPEYVAPETLNQTPQGFGVDVWALGVFLFEMLVGRTPFSEPTRSKLYKNVLNSSIRWPRPELGEPQLRESVVNLLNRIFIVDPEKRITVNEILEDSFCNYDHPSKANLKKT